MRKVDNHAVVIGDFNYLSIDYETSIVNAGPECDASKIYYKMLNLDKHQKVTELTSVRQGQKSSMLEYVFTDEQNMIELINYDVPLGKSDHVCLQWLVKSERLNLKGNQIELNYWKGNFDEISKKPSRNKTGNKNFKAVVQRTCGISFREC